MSLLGNIISYWKLDVDNATQVDSAGSNDGTVTGATFTASGKINGGYDFDGSNDLINFGDINGVDGTATFTVNFWANIDALKDWQSIFEKRLDANNRIYCGFSGPTAGDNNDVLFLVGESGSGHGYSTANVVGTGSWNMWTFVFNGGGAANADKIKVFKNGSELTLTYGGTIPAATDDNSADVIVGKNNENTVWFDGKLDELSVWSRNLSTAEIVELYNGGDGLQYPFGENSIFFGHNF